MPHSSCRKEFFCGNRYQQSYRCQIVKPFLERCHEEPLLYKRSIMVWFGSIQVLKANIEQTVYDVEPKNCD